MHFTKGKTFVYNDRCNGCKLVENFLYHTLTRIFGTKSVTKSSVIQLVWHIMSSATFRILLGNMSLRCPPELLLRRAIRFVSQPLTKGSVGLEQYPYFASYLLLIQKGRTIDLWLIDLSTTPRCLCHWHKQKCHGVYCNRISENLTTYKVNGVYFWIHRVSR